MRSARNEEQHFLAADVVADVRRDHEELIGDLRVRLIDAFFQKVSGVPQSAVSLTTSRACVRGRMTDFFTPPTHACRRERSSSVASSQTEKEAGLLLLVSIPGRVVLTGCVAAQPSMAAGWLLLSEWV